MDTIFDDEWGIVGRLLPNQNPESEGSRLKSWLSTGKNEWIELPTKCNFPKLSSSDRYYLFSKLTRKNSGPAIVITERLVDALHEQNDATRQQIYDRLGVQIKWS